MPGADMGSWGRVTPDELSRLVVVSPHLDDAVLGAANLLAGSPDPVVVTVYAGAPAAYSDPPTTWDRNGGFVAGDDVVARRRDEDRAGLATLGATPVWLDQVDSQYRTAAERVDPQTVAADLEQALRRLDPTAIAIPFGLGNDDHVDTHDAALLVRDRLSEVSWFCYEDGGYKHIPGLLAWRIGKLFRFGVWPTPCAPPVGEDSTRRRTAFAHYRSQVAALGVDWHVEDILAAPAPEQLWRLETPPEGWEMLATI